MPIRLEVLDGGKGRIASMSGAVGATQLIAQFVPPPPEDVMAVLPYSLWDFSAVEKFTASVDELRELGLVMREVATHGREGRFTALAAPQPLIFGQLRQFEVFVGAPEDRRVEFRIVSSREDAETWINERMTAADGPDSAPFETAG